MARVVHGGQGGARWPGWCMVARVVVARVVHGGQGGTRWPVQVY